MRKCARCGKVKLERELVDRVCGRCDHLIGNVWTDIQAEFEL